MFRIFRSRTQQSESEQNVTDAWNSALDEVRKLIEQHVWAVDEDDPHEIFCDGCGQSLTRALDSLRR